MSDNVALVQELFAAFGRGDMDALLNQLTDDVEWSAVGTADVPHARTYHGKAEVGNFFAALGGAFEFESFEPQEFLPSGDAVIVLGTEKVRARQTRREAINDWAMIFRFADEKIAYFRVYENSAALADALR